MPPIFFQQNKMQASWHELNFQYAGKVNVLILKLTDKGYSISENF